ncbi:MAG: hypothetical protein STSR0004_12160 [Peptococcaceae bacterium]
MSGEKNEKNRFIVSSGQQGITKYSSDLIRRGLDSIAKIEQKDKGIIPYRRKITPENASQVRQIGQLNIGNYVIDVKFSPDDKVLAVASGHGIEFYNTNNFEGRLWIESGYTIWIEFSHDGTTLASVSFLDIESDIKPKEKLMLIEYPRSHEFPHCCYINIRSILDIDEAYAIFERSHNEFINLVDEWDEKKAICLWRVFDGFLLNDTDAEYFNFKVPWSHMLIARIMGSPLSYRIPEDYSGNGIYATVGDNGISVLLRHDDDDSLLCELEGHIAKILCLAFNHDGTILASGSPDGTVRLWGLA